MSGKDLKPAKDITGGLPRGGTFRGEPKEQAVITEIDGEVSRRFRERQRACRQ